ncbi:hypothetical protein KI387_042106, partial [Taxus chinensis]
ARDHLKIHLLDWTLEMCQEDTGRFLTTSYPDLDMIFSNGANFVRPGNVEGGASLRIHIKVPTFIVYGKDYV